MSGLKMWQVKQIGQVICTLLFCLTAAIFITIIGTLIYYPIDAINEQLPQLVDLSLAQLLHNYHVLLAYLHFPWQTVLHFPDFFSSPAGLAHFADVKKLFILNYVLMFLSAVVALPTLHHWRREGQLWRLHRGFEVGAILPVLIGGLAATNFDQFFVTFHHLFFKNATNWLFDPSLDPIINVLPESFFMHCFIIFFVIFELMMLSGIYFSRFKK